MMQPQLERQEPEQIIEKVRDATYWNMEAAEVRDFMKETGGATICVFEIGDNEGDLAWGAKGWALENSDLFSSLAHVLVNNH